MREAASKQARWLLSIEAQTGKSDVSVFSIESDESMLTPAVRKFKLRFHTAISRDMRMEINHAMAMVPGCMEGSSSTGNEY